MGVCGSSKTPAKCRNKITWSRKYNTHDEHIINTTISTNWNNSQKLRIVAGELVVLLSCQRYSTTDLCVVFLDAAAAVDVERLAAASAALSAEAAASSVALVAADADAEQEGRNEKGGPSSPGEAKGVGADVGLTTFGLKSVACLDERCAIEKC